MKKTKIADNEMYSIDITPLTTKYKKRAWIIKNIWSMVTVAGTLVLVWAVVLLYLVVTGK